MTSVTNNNTNQPISFLYSSVDGIKRMMHFWSKQQAIEYAQKWLGPYAEVSRYGYAVSDDGIGKISDLKGITFGELFPRPPMQPMSNKSKEVKDVIESVFPGTKEAIEAKKCPICRQPISEFRDALSIKEYTISGMCQKCQDDTFGA